MARLVSVTVKERNDIVYSTALVAALPGNNILYTVDKTTDTEIKAINRDSAAPDIYLVDEVFATLTTAINAANTTNGQNVVDVNVDKIDDKDYATPLDRTLNISNIIFAQQDPDNLTTKTRLEVWDPQRARKEVWIVAVALATFITNCNA